MISILILLHGSGFIAISGCTLQSRPDLPDPEIGFNGLRLGMNLNQFQAWVLSNNCLIYRGTGLPVTQSNLDDLLLGEYRKNRPVYSGIYYRISQTCSNGSWKGIQQVGILWTERPKPERIFRITVKFSNRFLSLARRRAYAEFGNRDSTSWSLFSSPEAQWKFGPSLIKASGREVPEVTANLFESGEIVIENHRYMKESILAAIEAGVPKEDIPYW
ncbi:MAG TPA: hypothetical protein DEA96_03175 [Leptospiraceae bacterium]|nr:hypothetical protein [Spirochaetaceae bacterium]HBS03941.1 hypothetical protein [Leptospiraceae bacterium]|tara:strand:- start:27517 stop:28167 length:651 start_codon:yes stop_codon:yes gene_type:complete